MDQKNGAKDKVKPSILIVDDDESVLASLRIALSHLYAVHVCSSATRGVVEARLKKPAAIILDIKMPDQDGFWLFREIRKFDQTTPIIFNSAFQDIVTPSDIEQHYTPFAYLPKSGSLKHLLSVVASAVLKKSSP